MNKGLIFLCLACGLLALTIVTICVAPNITGRLFNPDDNCQIFADKHKQVKDDKGISDDDKDKMLKYLNKGKHLCERQKAMFGLEYASLISDLVFGFTCTLLSLLHFFDVGKPFEKITGLIGLISGIIGFILTLIYIIYSGYIFTNDNEDLSYNYQISDASNLNPYEHVRSPKLDKNREIAKLNDKDKYECIYYDEDDYGSLFPKYSDLGKKQYNYHKDFEFPDADSEYLNCQLGGNSNFQLSGSGDPDYYSICKTDIPAFTKDPNCKYIYIKADSTSISNKYQYDRWVTSIIFGCFIILLNLGLAVFGFLMFKESDGTSGHVTLK